MDDREASPGTPGWVKVSAIVALALVLLVAIVLVAGVGGGDHGSGRHGPSGGDAGQLPSGAGAPANEDEADRMVDVAALDAMTSEPGSIEVSAGETVTFVVTNSGDEVHEFTLGDDAMQREHADMKDHMPDGVAHAFPNSITLPPGETGRLTWRFGEMGTLEYACHVAGHYEAGMRGPITMRQP